MAMLIDSPSLPPRALISLDLGLIESHLFFYLHSAVDLTYTFTGKILSSGPPCSNTSLGGRTLTYILLHNKN